MTENRKTGIFLAVAVLTAVIAWCAVPTKRAPKDFEEQGEMFYPEFDQSAIKTMEVVSPDAEKGDLAVFRVEFDGKRWVIPSHEDYPADVKEQLVKTATAFSGLKKGTIRSVLKADLAQYDLLDPTDKALTSMEGAGKRLTLTDGSNTLADFIIGDPVEGRGSQYYVRTPGSSRVYACDVDAASISTRFGDWAQTDVLRLGGKAIKQIVIDHYRVDERSNARIQGDVLALTRGEDSKWGLEGMNDQEEINSDKVTALTSALSDLTLVDVRRKPADVLDAIKRVQKGERPTLAEIVGISELASIGYHLDEDASGQILVLSKDGEVRVACEDGVVYTLLFGEVVYGNDEDKEEEPAEENEGDNAAEHRYLWVRVAFDASLLGERPVEPQKPAENEEPATEPPAGVDEPTEAPAAHAPEDAAEEPDAAEDADEADDEDPMENDDTDSEEPPKSYEEQVKDYEKALEDYNRRVADGVKRTEELKARFAEWYYVVSSDAYAKVNLNREDLVQEKKEEPAEGDAEGDGDDDHDEPAGDTPAPDAPAEDEDAE